MKHLLITTIAAVLVGCGPSMSIHEAANKGNIEAVKQHLVAGADVNEKVTIGVTYLHFAALRGHKEITELLIAEGADVNAKDPNGETPLDYANRGFSFVAGKLLRKHGGKTGEEFKAEGN